MVEALQESHSDIEADDELVNELTYPSDITTFSNIRLAEVDCDEHFAAVTEEFFLEVGMDNIFMQGKDFSVGSKDRMDLKRTVTRVMSNL